MHLLSTPLHPPDLLSILSCPPPDGGGHLRSLSTLHPDLAGHHDPSGHPEFRVMPMATHRGWPVAICEARVGQPFPSYATRRELRASLRSVHAVGILIFTDAAHSSFVWTWRERYPSGHLRYLEFDSRDRMEALRAAADRLGDFGEAVDGPADPDRDIEKLLEPLFQGMPTGEGGGEDGRSELALERIARCDDPDRMRAFWRRLRGVAILHPGCEDGVRLVRAAETLEMVFVAAIDRMRAFVADSTMIGGRRRPEHLRDMRTLAEAAEDRMWERDTRRYVRRLLIQQNLFAVVRSRTAGRTVARDLLRYAGVREGALPAIDCNIWREPNLHPTPCDDGVGTGERDSPTILLSSISGGVPTWQGGSFPTDEHLTEALDLHRRAWEMVRRARLAGGDFGDLRLAASRLERRRSLLRRQLLEMAADADESTVLVDELRFCRAPGERGLSLVVE